VDSRGVKYIMRFRNTVLLDRAWGTNAKGNKNKGRRVCRKVMLPLACGGIGGELNRKEILTKPRERPKERALSSGRCT